MDILRQLAELKQDPAFAEHVKPALALLLECIKQEAITKHEK
jgi:hypothetical protein